MQPDYKGQSGCQISITITQIYLAGRRERTIILENNKAVVLLSGGLDSTTNMAIAKDQKFDIYALSFRYGQRNNSELDLAIETAKAFDAIGHKIIDINLDAFGGSALTDDL